MEFVAEWLRRQFVALVNAGSNPVKLPPSSQIIYLLNFKFIEEL